ncbi:DUF6382 domain-containing protein [Longirhabdus pacifica]|uniref:DUF6382 domain-containing protein n=1 Tax=Longirhabdus pacifica TaxID=2305227 RepID=UPI001008A1A0|nr:DUF6382 domain-containing protein [Longirhabdus pacifica]
MKEQSTIFGFHYDFIRHDGHCIVLSKEGGIPSKLLSSLQVNMLQQTAVNGLLPLYVHEINEKVQLMYYFTGKRMLSQHLKDQDSFSEQQFLTCLLHICQTILKSESYMLHSSQFIVHPDFIFVGGDVTDVHLIYLPFEQFDMELTLMKQIEQLTMVLTPYVGNMDAGCIQSLLKIFQHPENSMEMLAKELEKLLQSSSPLDNSMQRESASLHTDFGTPEPSYVEHNDFGNDSGNDFKQEPKQPKNFNLLDDSSFSLSSHTKDKDAFLPLVPNEEDNTSIFSETSTKPKTKPKTKTKAKIKSKSKASANAKTKMNTENETESVMNGGQNPTHLFDQSLNKSSLTIVICIAGMIFLSIWYLFVVKSSEAILYICIGFSLLLADSMFVMLRIWKPPFLYAEQHTTVSTEPSMYSPIPHHEENFLATSTNEYYETLANNTTLLADDDGKTVLLRDINKDNEQEETHVQGIQHKDTPIRAWLLLSGQGEEKRIPIEGKEFIVGRDKNKVNYADQSVGVSKTHFEILNRESEYFVKDVGSSNGTFLNDEQLVPYKYYPLNNNDRIVMCSKRFRFMKESGVNR